MNFWNENERLKEIDRMTERERKKLREREKEIVLGYYTRVTYIPF